MSKSILDVIEYLLKENQKELAEVVISEIKTKSVTTKEIHSNPTQPSQPVSPCIWCTSLNQEHEKQWYADWKKKFK